ncbi:MAG: hypothetical protein ABIL89_03075 [candidate division WOR-3 bacterium]
MNFNFPGFSMEDLKIAMDLKDTALVIVDFLIENKDVFERIKNYCKEKGKNKEFIYLVKAVESRLKGEFK